MDPLPTAEPWTRRDTWISAGLITVGVVLRLRQYFFNRSLWFDETLLSLNIIHRGGWDLLRSLDNHQAAPAGFLLLEKLAVDLFGPSEYSLRLVPVLAGIASLYLFYRLLRVCVAPRVVLVALGLLALSAPQIDYSTEVRQYSSDVAVALMLLLTALSLQAALPPTRRHLIWFSVLGMVAVWFSHPSVFVLAGVGASLCAFALRKKRWRMLSGLTLVGVTWAISWTVCYYVTLRAVRWDNFLAGMWTEAFVPWNMGAYWVLSWSLDRFFGIFHYPVDIELSGLGAYTFLIAAISRRSEATRRSLVIAMSPAVAVLLAAVLHEYPLEGRFLLFMVPSLLLVVAVGVEDVRSATKSYSTVIGTGLVALLFFHPAWHGAYAMLHPHTKEEIRDVLDYVQAHKEPGDTLYLYWRTEPAFEYYVVETGRDTRLEEGRARHRDWSSPDGTIAGEMDAFGNLHGEERTGQFIKEIEELRGNARVWFLFNHVGNDNGLNEEEWFVQYLDQIGKKLDAFPKPGASAYLYALSPPHLHAEPPREEAPVSLPAVPGGVAQP